MLLRGIRYLFYCIYKITSINYGKEGGAIASFIIVSILLSINAITLFGVFNKLILKNPYISLVLLCLFFVIILIINYFVLVRNLGYKNIISYYEESQINKMTGMVSVLMYVLISLGLLVIVISIKI